MAEVKEVAGVGGNNIIQSENFIFNKIATRRLLLLNFVTQVEKLPLLCRLFDSNIIWKGWTNSQGRWIWRSIWTEQYNLYSGICQKWFSIAFWSRIVAVLGLVSFSLATFWSVFEKTKYYWNKKFCLLKQGTGNIFKCVFIFSLRKYCRLLF